MADFAHFITNREGICQAVTSLVAGVLRVEMIDPIVISDPPHLILDPESSAGSDWRRAQLERMQRALRARMQEYQPRAMILLCRSVHGSTPREVEADLPILERSLLALRNLELVDGVRLIGLLPCYGAGRWGVHKMLEVRLEESDFSPGCVRIGLMLIGEGHMIDERDWEIVVRNEILV